VLIDREFHQRVETASGVKIKLVRLAILPDDIHKFKLPPQKITDKDTRAAAFRKKFGKHAATVEALPVVKLRRRIERAVKGIIEFERWNRQASTEKAESDSISRVAEAFKKAKHG
jgi:ribosomal protein L31